MKTVTQNPFTRLGISRAGAQSVVFGWSRVRKMKRIISLVTTFVAAAPLGAGRWAILGPGQRLRRWHEFLRCLLEWDLGWHIQPTNN